MPTGSSSESKTEIERFCPIVGDKLAFALVCHFEAFSRDVPKAINDNGGGCFCDRGYQGQREKSPKNFSDRNHDESRRSLGATRTPSPPFANDSESTNSRCSLNGNFDLSSSGRYDAPRDVAEYPDLLRSRTLGITLFGSYRKVGARVGVDGLFVESFSFPSLIYWPWHFVGRTNAALGAR